MYVTPKIVSESIVTINLKHGIKVCVYILLYTVNENIKNKKSKKEDVARFANVCSVLQHSQRMVGQYRTCNFKILQLFR
jgi:hypothetical protein